MAIYHLSAKIIGRSSGRSSVGASAYRAGEKLHNEYDGLTHDYTKKSGVVHSEIILPENAPAEYQDRETLWNAVEEVEKRSTSQLAREIEIALPNELDREEQIKLVQDYVKDNFVNNGMCADINIHDKNDGNPHAHIMLTMRAIDEQGEWKSKATFVYELDKNGEKQYNPKNRQYKGYKENTTDWNNKEKIEIWRENWSEKLNEELEKKNISDRVDHRSFERQGIEQIPTVHLGSYVNQMEQRGIETARGNENREIEKANIEIAKLTQELKEIDQAIQDIKAEQIQADKEIIDPSKYELKPKEKAEQIQAEREINVSPQEQAQNLFNLEERYISVQTELQYRQASGQIAGADTPKFEEIQKNLESQLQKAEKGLSIYHQIQGKQQDIKNLKSNVENLKSQPLGSIKNRAEIKNKETQIENRQQEIGKLTQNFKETTNRPTSMSSVNSLQEQKELFSQAINDNYLEMKENYIELQTQAKDISMEYKTQLEIIKNNPDYEKIQTERSQLESNRTSEQYPTEKNGYRLPSAKSLVSDIEKISPKEKQQIAEKVKSRYPEVAERLRKEVEKSKPQRSQGQER